MSRLRSALASIALAQLIIALSLGIAFLVQANLFAWRLLETALNVLRLTSGA